MFKRIALMLLLTILFYSIAHVQPSGGTIQGKMLYSGPPPKAPLISMAKDPNCLKINAGKKTFDDKLVVSASGQLKNVFVHLKSGLPKKPYPATGQAPILDQKGCAYSPRVQGAMVGQSLRILNSGQTLHNIHSMSTKYLLNIAQPVAGMTYDLSLKTEEVMLQLKCEIHTWMESFIGVLSHPFYAVSEAAGNYAIKNVPAGTYVVQAWHDQLGAQTKEIAVAPGQTVTLDFNFAPKSAALLNPGFDYEVVTIADASPGCH